MNDIEQYRYLKITRDNIEVNTEKAGVITDDNAVYWLNRHTAGVTFTDLDIAEIDNLVVVASIDDGQQGGYDAFSKNAEDEAMNWSFIRYCQQHGAPWRVAGTVLVWAYDITTRAMVDLPDEFIPHIPIRI